MVPEAAAVEDMEPLVVTAAEAVLLDGAAVAEAVTAAMGEMETIAEVLVVAVALHLEQLEPTDSEDRLNPE